MCTSVKSPTPKEPEKKDPVYMRNPYLDGLGIGAETRGRNSLRIDPGSAPATPGKRTPIKIGYNDGAPLKWNDKAAPRLPTTGGGWHQFANGVSRRSAE